MILRVKTRNDLQSYKKWKIPNKTVKQFSELPNFMTGWKQFIFLQHWKRRKLRKIGLYHSFRSSVFYQKAWNIFWRSCWNNLRRNFDRKEWFVRASASVVFEARHLSLTIRWIGIPALMSASRKDFCRSSKNITSTVFWPDLTAIDYAKDTLKFMVDNDINFVPKYMNPASVTGLWWNVFRQFFFSWLKLKKTKRFLRNFSMHF